MREQIKLYAAHGFDLVEIEHRAGSHFMARFAQFTQPIVLTKNAHDPRALKNNLARLRSLARKVEEERGKH